MIGDRAVGACLEGAIAGRRRFSGRGCTGKSQLDAQVAAEPVVGFDDAPVATMVWPQLTTVRQPVRAIGRVAAELISQYQPHRQGWPRPVPRRHLPLELVLRGSLAPAPQDS